MIINDILDCFQKKQFLTEKAAQEDLDQPFMSHSTKVLYRIEQCPICEAFHLLHVTEKSFKQE